MEILEKENIDAILIENKYNLRYYTGFTGTSGKALITKENKYFFTDFRYIEQAEIETKDYGFKVINIENSMISKISEYIEKENIKTLGIEDKEISLYTYNLYNEKMKVKFKGMGNKLDLKRQIKTEKEILNIKKAVEITDIAFSHILNYIKEGVSEKELALELEYKMRKEGAEGTSFETIVASNYRSAMPHGVASDKKIEKEGFIKFDFGCYYNGYVSDMTRTIYFGENITEKHREIYNTVLKAQKMVLDKIKAGMTGIEVDRIARNYINSKGYEENFGHGLGHGLGLYIHEAPTLSIRSDSILKENMIVTVEPGIYIEGFGGVRIEDDVIIKKDGCEILNKSPKELIIIK